MKLFVYMPLLFFLLMSCTKEVELEQPEYAQKVVVDGYIETGKPAHVFLTLSSPYLTRYDSVSIRNTFLNYGKISLTSSLGEEEVLTLFREDRFFPPFVYKTVSIRGQTGARYYLKVEVKGRELTAVTTIPAPPSVVDAGFTQNTDTTGHLEVRIDTPANGEQYLFSRVRSRLEGEDFHPAYDPLTVIRSTDASPRRVRLLRSTEFGLYQLNADEAFYAGYDRYEYDLRDSVDVIAGTVDSVSYRILKSLFVDRVNIENPFAFNGNRIETNINGGIGRWTGIGIDTVMTVCGSYP